MITSRFRSMLSRLNKAVANQAFYVRLISAAALSSHHFTEVLSSFGSSKRDLQQQLTSEEL